MKENGLVSAYGRKRFKVYPGAVNEANVPNVVARGFGGRSASLGLPGWHLNLLRPYALVRPFFRIILQMRLRLAVMPSRESAALILRAP